MADDVLYFEVRTPDMSMPVVIKISADKYRLATAPGQDADEQSAQQGKICKQIKILYLVRTGKQLGLLDWRVVRQNMHRVAPSTGGNKPIPSGVPTTPVTTSGNPNCRCDDPQAPSCPVHDAGWR